MIQATAPRPTSGLTPFVDLLTRARAVPRIAGAAKPSAREVYGCVEWFDRKHLLEPEKKETGKDGL